MRRTRLRSRLGSRLRKRDLVAAGALVAVGLLAAACAAPPYQFVTSTADDVVIRLPRAWTVVRSGVPATSDGSAPASGSWLAVYDGASRPSLAHAQAMSAAEPVGVARSVVVTKAQGQAVTLDDLRDLFVPVSENGRAQATLTGQVLPAFRLILDQRLTTRTANGVHVVFSYMLPNGEEVFDQVAVTDAAKTRVHFFLVHCSRACYNTRQSEIDAAVDSFTVKKP